MLKHCIILSFSLQNRIFMNFRDIKCQIAQEKMLEKKLLFQALAPKQKHELENKGDPHDPNDWT